MDVHRRGEESCHWEWQRVHRLWKDREERSCINELPNVWLKAIRKGLFFSLVNSTPFQPVVIVFCSNDDRYLPPSTFRLTRHVHSIYSNSFFSLSFFSVWLMSSRLSVNHLCLSVLFDCLQLNWIRKYRWIFDCNLMWSFHPLSTDDPIRFNSFWVCWLNTYPEHDNKSWISFRSLIVGCEDRF